MTDEGARRRRDDVADFLEFAAARQAPVLQAASVVVRDPAAAHQAAVRTLAALAADWPRVREDGPEANLRSRLYREALAVASVDPEGDVTADIGPVDGVDARRAAAVRVLDALPPRVRAVAALRWLDDRADTATAEILGVPVEQVHDDAALVLVRFGTVDERPDRRPATEDEARDLLELVAEAVPDADLGPEAVETARVRRRTTRRRAVLAGGVVVAAGATALALRPSDGPVRPRPTPSPSASDGRLRAVPLAGATVHLAPAPDDEPSLPPYPDAAALALPERLGPGRDPLEPLSPAGTQASVRAVFLLRTGEDRYQPAVFLPRQTPSPLLVPMAPLRATEDRAGNRGFPLSPRAIAADRHRVAFAQPSAVVVLELRTTRAHRYAVPDVHLTSAGWASDGRTVVATGGEGNWLVDTSTAEVTSTVLPVNAGFADLQTLEGRTVVRGFSGRGTIVDTSSVDGPELEVQGDTVSNTEGWTCGPVYLGPVPSTGGRQQGLAAVQRDGRPRLRILAASTARGVQAQAYRPLGWGPRDTALVESLSTDGAGRPVLRLLAWDVIEARLYRVASVDTPAYPADGASDDPFTGVWAL
ncbi:hypothetical protein [Nostocoides sp. Soil756]|jgi:DNA-directed RNA polymerase specialized sigma24 family protein|uniref:hypothetical protein n=1 Tax=Nostocoides sp. Soil756 TaxID=1736399 RepID=UPI0006FE9418|nr:hypothetical protein [Tetrasphaera sp. Soil756]KRE62562.1 hypothetical protein ASG78_05970 [Tetrasphaera sp. Soil756]